VAGVDPSDNIEQNPFVHLRIRCPIEQYYADAPFDLATLRMVVEHVTEPEQVARALSRLLRPGGIAVVFTVNLWSPATILSRFTPFAVHHPIKKLLWGSDEKDTFPVHYKMNTRRALRAFFEREGLFESRFAYLDDLSTFGGLRLLNGAELLLWRGMRKLRLRYPENCLLGVYRRDG
jgi:SAM-dependent methyltransferase